MIDPRVANLARILVGYSTKVGAGETCVIEGSTAAEPLVAAVYEEVLRAGGNPIVALSFEGQSATYYREATDAQLDWISPLSEWAAEQADCRIAIGADTNTRELSGVPPERQTRRQAATRHLMKRTMERAAEGSHRWVYTLYPTNALRRRRRDEPARVRGLLLPRLPRRRRRPARRLEARLGRVSTGSPSGPGARGGPDHRPGHRPAPGDRRTHFIPCDGKHNMPDGEFFTGPVEDSVEGEVSFHLPAVIGGREVSGVRLRFESGKVVDATAERGEEFLIELLDTDEGARRLGELGIGTNYGIDRGTRDVLLDEKIGGTVHLAVGASYPESGGTNDSAVHTDMVCDLRQGGRIEVDGELLQARRHLRRLIRRNSARVAAVLGRRAALRVLPGRGGAVQRHRRRDVDAGAAAGLEARPRPAFGSRPRPKIRAMSGHSKWSSIKHKKAATDAKRGQLFTKLARAIAVAAREGGGDPDANFTLAAAIEKAKGYSMPKDNIQRAIDRGTGAGGGDEQIERVVYEGYGPGGVAILVEALTDNRNRTGSEVRHAFDKARRQPRRARLGRLAVREEGRGPRRRRPLRRGGPARRRSTPGPTTSPPTATCSR